MQLGIENKKKDTRSKLEGVRLCNLFGTKMCGKVLKVGLYMMFKRAKDRRFHIYLLSEINGVSLIFSCLKFQPHIVLINQVCFCFTSMIRRNHFEKQDDP